MLWVFGLVHSLIRWTFRLARTAMIPRSGSERACLEAMYCYPRDLATVIFAPTVILNISSGICLECPFTSSSDVLLA